MQTLALIITCHEAYVPLLPAAVAGWDAQRALFTELIVVLDGVKSEVKLPQGWRAVRGGWGNANLARNAALGTTAADWIIHWDADNSPPPDYAAKAHAAIQIAGRRVGVLAPLVRTVDSTTILNEPVMWGAVDAAAYFCVDTASVWRREAMLHAGGWNGASTRLDDWCLAKDMVARGWVIKWLRDVVVMQEDHEERMTRTNSAEESAFLTRRVGIVALMSGRMDVTARWYEALKKLTLPERVGLTLMLPADRPGMKSEVWARLGALAETMERVTLLTAVRPVMTSSKGPRPDFTNLHRVVGGLYAQAIEATPEEVILTWEDDVFPDQPDALARLLGELMPSRGIAAVAAAYPSRHRPDLVCVARDSGNWTQLPKWEDLTEEVTAVGCLAGGFTVWMRAALQQCPILGPEVGDNGSLLGWDGAVSRALVRAKWKLRLHEAVRCEHACKPRATAKKKGMVVSV